MQYIFSQDMKFRTWRKLWIALAETEKELGLNITQEQIDELKAHAEDINYDVAKERERQVRHDVMSHVYAYGVQCPKAKGIIHLGATSCYVGDNTDIIVMTEALKLVRKKLVNVIAELADFAEQNSIINKYMAEMRDKDYQTNRLLFRNNIMRVGELIAYELSKTFDYEERDVQTPLGTARVSVPTDKLVLGTIFRAGLPFHQGFLNIFDHAGNAFVSAFREYEDEAHTKVGIHVEYLATPDLNNATLLIVDPMLATGGSMEMGYKALLTKGTPKKVHVVCVMASPEGIEHIRRTFPDDTTIWCAAIDPGLNEHKYIVPGFGDAGDLCYGGKI